MRSSALDFNIVLMSVAHCQVNLASEGLVLFLLCFYIHEYYNNASHSAWASLTIFLKCNRPQLK